MSKHVRWLSVEKALKKGADLWMVSDPAQNMWNQKIDWYLSFFLQKTRNSQLKSLRKYKADPCPILSQEIAKLIGRVPKTLFFNEENYKTAELPLYKQDMKEPILIETSHRLPNLWTMELVYTNKKQWISQAHALWKNLNCPSLRVFAPSSIQAEDVETTWPAESQVEWVRSMRH